MSLSSTALKQREKEAKALRSFLIYSSIGSFVLHIGLLTLFVGYFLIKIPQVKDEPIELTLIEVPNQEVKKLPEIQESPSKVNAGGSSGGGGGKFAQQQTSTGADTFSTSVVKQPNIQPPQQLLPQKTPVITSPIQKLTDTSKTSPQQPTTPPETAKPVVTQPPITNEPPLEPNSSTTKLVESLKSPPPQRTIPTAPSNSIPPVPASSPSPTSINAQSNGTQRSLTSSQTPGSLTTNASGNFTNNASSNGSGNGVGNGVGNGSGNGVGDGSGNGVGNGSGDGVGNQPKKEEVATAPKPPTDKGSFLDRADCIKCDYKYPDRARRLGIQGNAKMALNADENGNVTSVKLIDSTGDRELDEAAQTSARDWKLKPRDGGRQGVLAVIKFSLKKRP